MTEQEFDTLVHRFVEHHMSYTGELTLEQAIAERERLLLPIVNAVYSEKSNSARSKMINFGTEYQRTLDTLLKIPPPEEGYYTTYGGYEKLVRTPEGYVNIDKISSKQAQGLIATPHGLSYSNNYYYAEPSYQQPNTGSSSYSNTASNWQDKYGTDHPRYNEWVQHLPLSLANLVGIKTYESELPEELRDKYLFYGEYDLKHFLHNF